MQVNHHIAALPAGYLFADIAKRVRQYEETHQNQPVIRMGIGDVTRPLSPTVAKAFAEAAQGMATKEGFHGYAPDGGYPFLRQAILKNEYHARGVDLQADEIFVSDGAKSDTADLQEIFSRQARIAVTDPVYPVYVDANAMAGRLGTYQDGRWEHLTLLPCTFENGFVPPLPTQKVDVLYLCCPNNPTGTMLTHAQLKVFVDWAREHEAILIYDAAYKAFVKDPSLPKSIFEVEGAREVAIECGSFSKTAGFTGVRCAWTAIPKSVKGRLPSGDTVSLNALWARRTGSKFNGVSFPVQKAAEAVYSVDGQKEIQQTLSYYQENARILLDALKDTGLQLAGGVHAPYVWLKTPHKMSGWELFDHLLYHAQVVGTPGEGFGPGGANCFRLTAFSTRENTLLAAQKIKSALAAL